jgi:hypothetical protein
VDEPIAGSLHHVELWVPDLGRAVQQWGWLLGRLGYESFQAWPDGRSWRLGGTYLVVEQSPAMTAGQHDRLRPGLNHLALHAGPRHSCFPRLLKIVTFAYRRPRPEKPFRYCSRTSA